MLRARKGKVVGLGLIVLAAIVGVTALASGAGAKQTSLLASLPREQTLYMSGNQWSPNIDLNPAKNWDYVTGLVGFVYETPFRYDPLKGKFIPWLATSGKWTSTDDVLDDGPPGRQVERRPADDAGRREVQLRPGEDRRPIRSTRSGPTPA